MRIPTSELQAIESNLRGTVEYLAGTVGERNPLHYQALERASAYVARELAEAGYAVEKECYLVEGREYRNLIASLEGGSSAEEILVVGAHYDSAAGTPGADDNASGVAVLLELARLLRSRSPHVTVRLVAFTLEEPPYFRTRHMGSRVHARRSRRRKDRIVGMVSLEMVGYYKDTPRSQSFPLPLMRRFYGDRGDFIALAGNFRSRRLVRRLAQLMRRDGLIPVESVTLPLVPGVGLSDNRSFWKEGYPALMVTDTAFFRNPNYHGPWDVPGTLDYRRMAVLAAVLVSALCDFVCDRRYTGQ